MRLEKIREKLEETDEGFFCLDCGEMIMTQEQVEEDGTLDVLYERMANHLNYDCQPEEETEDEN